MRAQVITALVEAPLLVSPSGIALTLLNWNEEALREVQTVRTKSNSSRASTRFLLLMDPPFQKSGFEATAGRMNACNTVDGPRLVGGGQSPAWRMPERSIPAKLGHLLGGKAGT